MLSIFLEKTKIILVVAYLFYSQFNLDNANHISKFIPLIILVVFLGIKEVPLKMTLFLMAIPSMIFINLLMEKQSNTEGWTFFTIHLCAAITAILITNHEVIKNKLKLDRICSLIICYGVVLIIISIIEFILGDDPGRFFVGSQNLTSASIVLTIPFAFLYLRNKLLKYLYIISAFIVVAFIIKSRGLSVFMAIIIIYYVKDYLKIFKNNFLLTVSVTALFILIVTQLNPRFDDLLAGNPIYYRFYAWIRFIQSVVYINPIFGYGPSNIVINFNQFQFIYPQIELLHGLQTFYNPHSDWLFIFASGGIVFLLLYLFLHGFLIFKFFNYQENFEKNKYLTAVFVCYLILLISSQYDINNSSYPTLLFFYLIQSIIFKNIIDEKYILVNQNILKLPLVFIISLTLYFQTYSLNIVYRYQGFAYHQLHSNKFIEWNLGDYASHFMISDTLKAYHYLNVSGNEFNDVIFNQLIDNSRKYNKYLEPSLHLSTQYYSFKNDHSSLLNVYSDILYKILADKRIINIGVNPANINVSIGDKLRYEVIGDHHKISITSELFLKLILSSSSFGKITISDFSDFKFDIKSDNLDGSIYNKVANDFLYKIAGFSTPLKM